MCKNIVFKDLEIFIENQKIIKNVSFKAENNSITSIIGKSGCGKTTFLKAVAGLQKHSFGYMINVPINFSFVFQFPVLFPFLTVYQNIELPLRVRKIKKNKRKDLIFDLLKVMDLSDEAYKYAYMLSGGEKQRVSIARAFITQPELVLMDEPFSAIDEIKRFYLNKWLIDILVKINSTVLFVTHSCEEAVFLSKKIVLFSEKPATVNNVFDIDLEYPRNRFSGSFFEKVNLLRKNMI